MEDIGLLLGLIAIVVVLYLLITNRACAIIALVTINGSFLYYLLSSGGTSLFELILGLLILNGFFAGLIPNMYIRAFSSASTEEIFKAQDKLYRKSSNTPPKKPNDDMDFVLDENGNIIWLHEKK